MKYIVSKEQSDKMKGIIFHVFDIYLTPIGGWEPEKYVRQLEVPLNDYELFLDLQEYTEDGDLDDHNHIFYSMCENPNYTYKNERVCPEVSIPKDTFQLLNSSFGAKIWKPYFLEWFTENSKLPVKKVRTFNFSN